MTRILLDTNVLIFALLEPHRLPVEIADVIRNASNDVLFSAGSIWEIAIKAALGRASFKHDASAVVRVALRSGMTEIPIRSDVTIMAADLPAFHKDPFDRLLVAHAMCEPAKLLSSDRILARYSPLVQLFDPR